jgi:hypothetical protein
MQSGRRLKQIKIFTVAFVASLTGWCLPSQAISSSVSQQEDRSRFEIVGQDTPTEARFGTDDGVAFVLHFTGDIHGSLEPCG